MMPANSKVKDLQRVLHIDGDRNTVTAETVGGIQVNG
jgi:hypothetical protein